MSKNLNQNKNVVEYPPEMNAIEDNYAEFIANNLKDSELVAVLRDRNIEPITKLINDMEAGGEDIMMQLGYAYRNGKKIETEGSKDNFQRFQEDITAKVLDIFDTKRRKIEEKESCARFIKQSSIESLKFCVEDLLNFTKAMNVNLSREEAEELSVTIAGGLGNKLHDFVFEIIREFCKENGIIPGNLK
jgi:hypothetical protein